MIKCKVKGEVVGRKEIKVADRLIRDRLLTTHGDRECVYQLLLRQITQ